MTNQTWNKLIGNTLAGIIARILMTDLQFLDKISTHILKCFGLWLTIGVSNETVIVQFVDSLF